nr:MATE family efflux transporter [Xylanibacter rodentium]
MPITQRDRQILRIAGPSIVSNITVPLLGLVDVAIVGHLGDAAYIGAIAVGSMAFNLIYWIFGFLRMGTSGMTSQAFGRRDLACVMQLLVRSLTVALAVALTLIVLQWPLEWTMVRLMRPTADVEPWARTYFSICIWGAPAVLGLYGLMGWFVGMQNTRMPMFISIMQNVVNIFASLTFVYGLGMRIEGVATGTVIAQYAGFAAAIVLLLRHYGRLGRYMVWRGVLQRNELWRFFTVNRDIFLRTLCLVAVNLYFTSAGARQGAVILAVNTVLMQLFLLFSYIMDGFANAGEALGGRYYGARNGDAFRDTVRRLFLWGLFMAAAFTVVYAIGGMPFLRLLTDDEAVISASSAYFPWALVIPLCSMAAFVWDGIFIGVTATRGMLVSLAVSASVFFVTFFCLSPWLGNHALWLAMTLYLAVRGMVQTVLYRRDIAGKI